ncbi:hypothetical protein JCM19240_4570 [Vibrio maritimus]|uniref:Uncharacterized protein n=1 Tax=Vibrio maritimus TaxID=990268 RepID=A0A090U2E8_9VIBR|nr:hypothetical protein JCM19240_4570 [Vibrio maritimus]
MLYRQGLGIDIRCPMDQLVNDECNRRRGSCVALVGWFSYQRF